MGRWVAAWAAAREGTLAMPADDQVGAAGLQLYRERLHRARLPRALAHERRRLQRTRLCRGRAMQHDQADCRHVSRRRLAQAQLVGCSGRRLQCVLRVGAPRRMLWAPAREVRRRPRAGLLVDRHQPFCPKLSRPAGETRQTKREKPNVHPGARAATSSALLAWLFGRVGNQSKHGSAHRPRPEFEQRALPHLRPHLRP